MSLKDLQLHGPRIIDSPPCQPLNLLGIKSSDKHHASPHNPAEDILEVKESPNRGLGTFARTDVPEFTQIIADDPLLTIHESENLPHLWANFQNLDNPYRAQVLELDFRDDAHRDNLLFGKLEARGYPTTDIPQMVKLGSIFQANAFNVVNDAQSNRAQRVLFPTMARVNHSCTPNAHCNYDPGSNRMTAYTLRNIERGEEIEISYFNLLLSRDQRQARAENWNFKCTCPACSEELPSEYGHEARRERIRTIELGLLQSLTSGASITELRLRLEDAREMLELVLGDRALFPQLPIAYDYVAMLLAVIHDVDSNEASTRDILDNLALAVEAESNITGANSQATKRRKDKLATLQNAT